MLKINNDNSVFNISKDSSKVKGNLFITNLIIISSIKIFTLEFLHYIFFYLFIEPTLEPVGEDEVTAKSWIIMKTTD
jgi:hypothetical protein